MKTVSQLHEILRQHDFARVDAHIHTHLCDGSAEMTVSRITAEAEARGMTCVILTPHFHRHVEDDTASLYPDSDESIFLRLREEIEAYSGPLTVLLSTEADILSPAGETSLAISSAAEAALDLVTPTVNYHPLLPLKAVEVTYGRCIGKIHGSGLYAEYCEAAGGVEAVLTALYETEANAILRSPYPAMVGHFLAAHSYAVEKWNWFGAEEKHLPIMKDGAEKLLDACQKTGAMVDLTGIHHLPASPEGKQKTEGFFLDFQRWFLQRCREKAVPAFPGTDSHSPDTVGDVRYYTYL